jgi:hypothetical protein
VAGHDGGARVRVRILFKDSLAGDVYTLVYLTSGSRRNVWTRTLLDSLMATIAPDQFRNEALSEKLIGFALQSPDDGTTQTFAETLRNDGGFDQKHLEQVVNNSGYAIRSNLGVDAALPVFTLNTVLFPQSANTWDSLAEAYEAKGDKDKANALRLKMNTGRDASQRGRSGHPPFGFFRTDRDTHHSDASDTVPATQRDRRVGVAPPHEFA